MTGGNGTTKTAKPYGAGTNRRSAEALLRVAVDDAVAFFRAGHPPEVAFDRATAELRMACEAAELLLERT